MTIPYCQSLFLSFSLSLLSGKNGASLSLSLFHLQFVAHSLTVLTIHFSTVERGLYINRESPLAAAAAASSLHYGGERFASVCTLRRVGLR